MLPDINDKEVTIKRANALKEVKSLISYAVGCMFGRYILDESGLIYAGGEFNKDNYKSFEADVDNFFECDDWYEEFEENTSNPLITIGGYANFTQTDPREYKIKDKEVCLFKLDSYYNSRKFNIGDIGIIFALISKDDIKKCNFENTIVDWDCI